MTLGAGSVVADKYRIERVIGEGGMGVVFAALHLELEQRVALKVVRDELTEKDEAVERMLREARNAARLRSDHVARVLDVSRLASGAPYIVMELLEGEDLSRRLNFCGRLPAEEAVLAMLQVCEAVAEAHAAGIVHRDLKLENLFLATRADGTEIVKVLDFGVSKHLSADRRTRLTNPTKAIGSPDYMAPEQMRAFAANDLRADIWSLGAVLYELLTGLRPFEADTLPAVCARVLGTEPETPRNLVEEIPEGLEAVVLRCLRKDPDERFQTVVELAEALAPFGPPGALELAERVARVVSHSSSNPPRFSTPGSFGPITADVRVTAPPRRSLAHAITQPAPRKHRFAVVAAIGIAALLGVAIVAAQHEGAPMEGARHLTLPSDPPVTIVKLPWPSPVLPPHEEAGEDAEDEPKTQRLPGPLPRRAPAAARAPMPVEADQDEEGEGGEEEVDAWDPTAFGGRR